MNDLEKKKQTATDAEQAYNDMNYNDFKQGEEYKQLENQTRYQGEQAMKDTMGQASARTGGFANSYAISAAQQAQNAHMANLENAARALYDNQKQEKLEKMEVANAIYDRDKAQYEAEADKYKNNLYTDLSLMTDEELKNYSWSALNDAAEYGMTEDDFNRIKKTVTGEKAAAAAAAAAAAEAAENEKIANLPQISIEEQEYYATMMKEAKNPMQTAMMIATVTGNQNYAYELLYQYYPQYKYQTKQSKGEPASNGHNLDLKIKE